jgi:hypothetical protein
LAALLCGFVVPHDRAGLTAAIAVAGLAAGRARLGGRRPGCPVPVGSDGVHAVWPLRRAAARVGRTVGAVREHGACPGVGPVVQATACTDELPLWLSCRTPVGADRLPGPWKLVVCCPSAGDRLGWRVLERVAVVGPEEPHREKTDDKDQEDHCCKHDHDLRHRIHPTAMAHGRR